MITLSLVRPVDFFCVVRPILSESVFSRSSPACRPMGQPAVLSLRHSASVLWVLLDYAVDSVLILIFYKNCHSAAADMLKVLVQSVVVTRFRVVFVIC